MGFSLTGLIIVLVILAPNLFMMILPPRNVPKNMKSAGAVLTIVERLGQIGCFVLPVISRDAFNARGFDAWLALMALCIAAYWALWIRYAVKGREFRLLFAPLWLIPVPMAVFPVLAFASAALWARSPWLGIASATLAIGHIASSRHSYRLLKDTDTSNKTMTAAS